MFKKCPDCKKELEAKIAAQQALNQALANLVIANNRAHELCGDGEKDEEVDKEICEAARDNVRAALDIVRAKRDALKAACEAYEACAKERDACNCP